jgi:hypothetical protein
VRIAHPKVVLANKAELFRESAFADDAALTDFGRTFAGEDEIARWSDNENIATRNRITVTDVTWSGSTSGHAPGCDSPP